MKRFFENTLKFCFVLMLLASCEMEKKVDLDMPEYEPELVVECYLTHGKPYKLSVYESTAYTERPEPVLVPDAQVIISHNGVPETLTFNPYLDTADYKFYTHTSPKIANGQPGDIYTIEITDRQGRKLTGTTSPMPEKLLTEVSWRLNEEEEAYLLFRFQDPPETEDFYRLKVNRDSITGSNANDYIINDRLNNGQEVTINTSYRYDLNDTLIVSFYQISKEYYDFLSSVDDARDANGNPFAQPSGIKSTVKGGIGVFTYLNPTRKDIIVR